MWWRKTERTDKRDGCPDPRGARVFTLQQASEWDTLDEWSSTKQFFFFQDCKVKPAAAGIRSFSQIKALYILVDLKKKKLDLNHLLLSSRVIIPVLCGVSFTAAERSAPCAASHPPRQRDALSAELRPSCALLLSSWPISLPSSRS